MSVERSIARDRAIEEHLPLVRRLARGFGRCGVEMDDLVQIGSIGLIHAVDRFDVARGVSLATYATPCIVGEMQRHLRDRALVVRVPRRIQQERARRRAAEPAPSGPRARGRPSWGGPAESADAGDARADRPGGDDPVRDLLVHLADPRWREDTDESEAATNRVAVTVALRRLDPRGRQAIESRFFEDLSQEAIASRLGISQVQVSRLLRSSLDRLRAELDDRVVADTAGRS